MTSETNGRTPHSNPILNSPYEEPRWHWKLDEQTNRAVADVPPEAGRRESAGILSVPNPLGTEEGQQSITLNETVNSIRIAVGEWREKGYPSATIPTQRLLNHWRDPQRSWGQLFFAQVEALETLVYLTEVADSDIRAGTLAKDVRNVSETANDGLHRMAVKMATGTGKTVVMGMVVCWHAVNRAAGNPDKKRYQRNFLAITPGLTVRDRLSVLVPSSVNNVYDQMGLLPSQDKNALQAARVKVEVLNYHQLRQRKQMAYIGDTPVGEDTKKLLTKNKDERERLESPGSFLRRRLRNVVTGEKDELVCVLNDEAHHCYKPNGHTGAEGGEDDKKAAVWYNALHLLEGEGVLGSVYDFSATPMFIATTGRKNVEMFPWVVSDFPLLDAIEAGMVKIPRVPVDDDVQDEIVKWRHLYEAAGKPKLDDPRTMPPELVNAINALYRSYTKKDNAWHWSTPPVFIVVAKNIKDAETLYRYLAGWSEDTCKTDEEGNPVTEWHHAGQEPPCPLFSNEHEVRTLLVHSRLEDEEIGTGHVRELMRQQAERLLTEEESRGKTKPDAAAVMREALNTVGKRGEQGESLRGSDIRCVVSVSMLTEGWDTRTVTHVLGFRPFGTQLLCEQVTGRALRRVSYEAGQDGLLPVTNAEVLGVPFDFVSPAAAEDDQQEEKEAYDVVAISEHGEAEMALPRLDGYSPSPTYIGMNFDPEMADPLQKVSTSATNAGIAGKEVILETEVDRNKRWQTLLTEAAQETVQRVVADWGELTGQADRLPRRLRLFQDSYKALEKWLAHNGVSGQDDNFLWLTTRSMLPYLAEGVRSGMVPVVPEQERVWHAVWSDIRLAYTSDTKFTTTLEDRYPALLEDKKMRFTSERCHLNAAACHSGFETYVAGLLDGKKAAAAGVQAWVRNYRLGANSLTWDIPYRHEGVDRRYEPDFVVRIGGGDKEPCAVHLIVEVKGVPDEESEAKKRAVLDRWIPAVEHSPATPEYLRQWQIVELAHRGKAATELMDAIAIAKQRADATRTAAENAAA